MCNKSSCVPLRLQYGTLYIPKNKSMSAPFPIILHLSPKDPLEKFAIPGPFLLSQSGERVVQTLFSCYAVGSVFLCTVRQKYQVPPQVKKQNSTSGYQYHHSIKTIIQ